MPQYEITALPDGYEEDSSQRIASVNYVGIEYRNKLAPDAPPIYLDYIYMQQGTVYDQVTDDATISDTIDAPLRREDILHMAESVSLIETTK